MSILNKQQTNSFRRATLRREARTPERRLQLRRLKFHWIEAKRFLHELDLAQIKSHLPRCNFF